MCFEASSAAAALPKFWLTSCRTSQSPWRIKWRLLKAMLHFSMGGMEWKHFNLDWCCLGFYLTCLGVNCSSGQSVLLRSSPWRQGWNLDLIENASLELDYILVRTLGKIEGSVQQKIRTIFSWFMTRRADGFGFISWFISCALENTPLIWDHFFSRK